jgi:hypothetical protein
MPPGRSPKPSGEPAPDHVVSSGPSRRESPGPMPSPLGSAVAHATEVWAVDRRRRRAQYPPGQIGKRALCWQRMRSGPAPVANLQQETAATNARTGGSGCAYLRLARHERRLTRRAPPLCKQWSHSIRANSNSDLSRAQFVPNTPPTAVTHGSPWSALSFACKEPPSQRASGFVLQAGHANSICVVALRPPAVASRLRSLTVASPRPVERSGGAACPSAPATAPKSPR